MMVLENLMHSPPYYFRRVFVLPLPGREEICRVSTLDYTERDVEVLQSWKRLGEYVYVEKLLERQQEVESFLHHCLQSGGSRLRDAYAERERLHPGIASEDLRFYTHCQVCHEPIAGRKAAWCAGQYHVGACYDTLFQRCSGCGKRRIDVLSNARNWRRPDPLCNECHGLKYGVGYSMLGWLKMQTQQPE